MAKQKINIGLLLDETKGFCLWQTRVVDQLLVSDFIDLKLLVFSNSQAQETESSFLYSIYQNLEKKRWAGVEDLSLILDKEPESIKKVSRVFLEKTSACELQAHGLDVILNFTPSSMPTEFVDCAKAGIWQWQFGDGVQYRQQQPAGFWEIFKSSPTMGATLSTILSGDPHDRVIYHTVFASDDRSSAFLNQKQACLIAIEKTILMLKRLAERGKNDFFRQSEKNLSNAVPDRNGCMLPPGNVPMLFFFVKKILTSIKMRLIHLFFSEEWTMRYKLQKEGQGMSMDYKSFKTLAPKQGGLWADPFIIYRDNHYYLFFEDAITDKENADISCISMDQKGNMSQPKLCLKRDYHLSYPFVFFWNNDYYMIPETKGNRTIEVYKASSFPDQWEFHCNLMEEVEAVDTTLYFHNSKWWMFTSLKPCHGVSINNELSIFYADSPLSQKWTPHLSNPVLSDVRKSRPAGRIYEANNKLFRPSQDSSVRYGYGFRINEIVTLTETEYKEKEIGFTEPNWRCLLRGTHTLAHETDLTVIDVLEWRLKYF